MIVLGIDLGGPANIANTALVRLVVDDWGKPRFDGATLGVSDGDIFARARADSGDALVVGLDGPLSYQPGGGDRPRDVSLRSALGPSKMKSSVMAPTITRMAYLTLRAVSVARVISFATPRARVCEVHPGGAYVLRGADVADVKAWKKSRAARVRSLAWAAEIIQNLPVDTLAHSDHLVAATGAALGALGWAMGETRFHVNAELPLHPFDLVA
jgi:predicted nuclease with RNAse H fold